MTTRIFRFCCGLVALLLLLPAAARAQSTNVVALDRTSYTVNENEGTAAIIVRVERVNTATVTVDYRTDDGTARAGSDYRTTSGRLTFAGNETAKLVEVPIIDDLEPENQEQFTFTILNAQGAVIDSGRSTATITIDDNDAARPTIGFTSTTYRVNENDSRGAITITVTRQGDDASLAQEMRVDYFTRPVTATEGVDYQRAEGTLTFGPGQRTAQFDVRILDDTLVEGDETFTVNLRPTPGDNPQYDFGISTATVTIIDNETSTVNFSASTYEVAENAGAATITLLRTGNTNTAGRVNVSTVAGTATADRDYATVSRTIDFAQGQTFATFDIPIFDDQEVEGTESFFVSLTSSPNSGIVVPGGTATAEVRIIDDETANTVEFAGTDFSVNENDPSGVATITVRLNRRGNTSDTVTVQYFTETGSATPNEDYTPISSASNSRLTFQPGETIKTFPIRIINDNIPENTETVRLVLANPTNATLGANSTATLSILDDDSAGTVQFSSSNYSVMENGGSVSLTVILNRTGNTNAPVRVNYRTVGGSATESRQNGCEQGADFVRTSGTLTFAPGSAVATLSVPVCNDTIVEPPESFLVILTDAENASLGSPSSATVTIQDDDGLNTVEFTSPEYGVVETDGSVQVTIRARRGADPNQTLTVEVAVGASGDTARNPEDYQDPSSATVVFPAGVNVQTLTIPITNNFEAQGVKTFTVRLTNPGAFTQVGRQSSARVTIFDNAGPNTVQFLTGTHRFREGDQAAIGITVVRYGDFNTQGTRVRFTTELRRGDTAVPDVNFTPTTGELFFAPLISSIGGRAVVVGNETQKIITIPLPNNTEVQGDVTFHVTLTSSDVAQFGSISTTLVTIEDDDLGNLVQFSSSTYSVIESAGNAVLTVNLIPNGDPSKASTVDFAATPITAFAGFDFSPVTGTLTFAPGETSKTIAVPINNDNIAEGPETFRVTLSNPSPGTIIGTPGSAIVTIIDDDVSSAIQFSPANYTVAENAGSVTLSLIANRQGNPNDVLTVRFETIGGTATAGADFVSASGTVTFGPGETRRTITVQILDDNLIESTENFSVVLSNPGPGASLGTASSATIDIADDDSPTASIGFSAPSYDVDEGAGFANLTVTRSGGLGVSATVNFETSDGTAKAGVHYVRTTGSVTFGVGEVSKVIQVRIIDNSISEPTVSFTVTLSAPDGTGFIGGQSTATVNIIDNDVTVFRFNPTQYSVDEGAGTVTLIVEALRVGDPSQVLTVDYLTTDGTATAGARYERTSGRLTFNAGATKQTFTVPLFDNTTKDGTQNFFVNLSNPRAEGSENGNPPRIGSGTATVSVIDNDATTFQFSSSSYTVSNSSGNAVLTVTLSRLSNADGVFTVDYFTSDVTAVGGRDYAPQSGRLTFGPGETSQTITIALTPQEAGQPTREFRVSLTNPSGGAELGTVSSASVRITNPDLSTKLMNVSTRGVVEQGNGVMIAGFIVQGGSEKQVVLRGIGPSLTRLFVPNAINDPTLQLMNANGEQLAFNDDYTSNSSTDQQVLTDNGLQPQDTREAAIVATLSPGAYTVILRGKTNGIGLVEAYDLSASTSTRLVNISTRAKVGQGDNGALIAGFIVAAPENQPGTAQQVVIRAIGPSLRNGGANISDALLDPTLEIYRGSQKILENDNWKTQTSKGVGTRAQIEATGLQPSNDKEAVIMTNLDPGSYTAVIRGKSNTTGVALAEVYQLNQ
jgi:hypothetical protein